METDFGYQGLELSQTDSCPCAMVSDGNNILVGLYMLEPDGSRTGEIEVWDNRIGKL